MKNPKPFALAGAAALLLTAAYSVQSSQSGNGKAAVAQSKRAYIQAKKDALRAQTGTAATSGARQRGTSQLGDAPNFANATPVDLIRGGVASMAGRVSSSAGAAGDICVTVTGTINPAGDKDFYTFDLLAGEIASVAVVSEGSGAPQDLYLKVWGPKTLTTTDPCGSATTIAEADDEYGLNMSTLDPCSFFGASGAGSYFIQVEDLLNLTGGPGQTYSATICVHTNAEVEPNNTAATANLFVDCVASSTGTTSSTSSSSACTARPTAASTVTGNLTDVSDVDCYSVCLQPGEVLKAHVTGAQCANDLDNMTGGGLREIDPSLTLSGAGGQAVNDDTDGTDPALFFTNGATAEVYSVCVSNHSSLKDLRNGYYRLEVSTSCGSETSAANGDCGSAQHVHLPRAATTSSSK